MESQSRNDPFQAYQLLPPAYRNQRRISKAICAWSAVTCTLLAILGGLLGATALEAERDYQARQQLVAVALPLLDLRRDVLRLNHWNRQRVQWCDWVESAQPDENAFQTLATIAKSSHSDGSNLKIDRIVIQMPLEHSVTDEPPPQWAMPRLDIAARVSSPDVAYQWIDRLNHSDRIANADIDDAADDLAGGRVEITATPIATRVLP